MVEEESRLTEEELARTKAGTPKPTRTDSLTVRAAHSAQAAVSPLSLIPRMVAEPGGGHLEGDASTWLRRDLMRSERSCSSEIPGGKSCPRSPRCFGPC